MDTDLTVKPKLVLIRVNSDEKQDIDLKASLCGITTSEYIRRRALSKPLRSVADLRLSGELRRLIGLMKHIFNTMPNDFVGKETAQVIRLARDLNRDIYEGNSSTYSMLSEDSSPRSNGKRDKNIGFEIDEADLASVDERVVRSIYRNRSNYLRSRSLEYQPSSSFSPQLIEGIRQYGSEAKRRMDTTKGVAKIPYVVLCLKDVVELMSLFASAKNGGDQHG